MWIENKNEKEFDASALRAAYDSAMPYDPLRERHLFKEGVPLPEVTNLVYGVPYSFDSEDGAPLYDRWKLAGVYLSDCLAHRDNNAHYALRIALPGNRQVCSALMHTSICIISGPKSQVDLVTVCNTLTLKIITEVPYAKSFHVGSFRNRLHNTVVCLSTGNLPINFAKLQPLLRPRNVVKRSDDVLGNNTGGVPGLDAIAADRIPHYIMAVKIPPKSTKQTEGKYPLIKMYERKSFNERGEICIEPKICINGIPSIDHGKAILLELYFFILENRERLLFSKSELLKMQLLRFVSELPTTAPSGNQRRKRLKSAPAKKISK